MSEPERECRTRAPISEVARHAGVGISALYSRYASKEELLRKLCRDGLRRFVDETEAALGDEREPWTVFRNYMIAAIKLPDRGRTELLRQRYLAVVLDGLRAPDGDQLPGPGPRWAEINERWSIEERG